MATNNVTFHTWTEASDGTVNLQPLSKITANIGTNGIVDLAIPTGKLANDAGITPAKNSVGVVGTATGPVVGVGATPFVVVADIATGATANDVVTATMPAKGKLIGVRTIKTSAPSGATNNTVSVRDTAAGAGILLAGSTLATWNPVGTLVVLPDTAVSPINTVNDAAAATLEAGATLFFCRSASAGDNAALMVLEFMPVA